MVTWKHDPERGEVFSLHSATMESVSFMDFDCFSQKPDLIWKANRLGYSIRHNTDDAHAASGKGPQT